MPATRSASPRVLDERKRTRANNANLETSPKSKVRKSDDAQSSSGRSPPNAKVTKHQTPDKELKTVSEISKKDEGRETVAEPAVKRGRGRPRKVDTPVVSGQRSPDVREGDPSEKRTDKHKDLIEVDKRGRRDSGRGSQKTGQQIGARNRDSETDEQTQPEGLKESTHSHHANKDSEEMDAESSTIADTDDGNGKPAKADDNTPKPKKRGRKPKRQTQLAEANVSEKDVDCTTQDQAEGDGMGLHTGEKSAKKQRIHEEEGDGNIKKKSTNVKDEVDKAKESDTLFSPRRSGRGTVPNSRYKDMHLFSTAKKQHQTSAVKTGVDTAKQDEESISKEEIKSSKKKIVLDDSKPFTDSPKPLSSDKLKEKAKMKPFSSGASMARAQAKAQQQAEAKGRTTEKFSIREIARGLEVTGRDGIPVVIPPENIVRVPLPGKSQQESDKQDTDDDVKSNNQSESQDSLAETTSQPICASDSQSISSKHELSVETASADCDMTENVSEVSIPDVGQIGGEDPESYTSASAPDTSIIEEVVETEVVSSAVPVGEGTLDCGTAVPSADNLISQTAVSGTSEGEQISDTPPRDSGSGSQMIEEGEGGVHVHLPDHPEEKSSVLSAVQVSSSAETNEQFQSDDGCSDGSKMLMMAKMTEKGNTVVLVDKTKKLPHQFLKDTLSSMPPAKPGYIISSPRRNSSVVKIVTLSSMLEEGKPKEIKDPEIPGTEATTTDTPTPSSSVSILQPEPITALPIITDVDSRPSGVDMILAGSKTVDAADADAATSEMEEKPDELQKTSLVQLGDSKFSSASTQTPIDREAEKTIIPTIYKTSTVPPLKTISVNLGKHELQEGEVGYELPESGTKPKSEEYILVELPEGATIQQRYVKSRTKIDDSMFLSSESVVQGIYHCTLCNYETNKKPNWYKHKKKHMGFREYECTQCEYRAATSSNLKRHLAIHEDVRAFSCPKCDLSFRQKIHLERHIKYKHEEKQIRCPFCEYMCANENPDLKVHIKRKHLPGHSPDGAINAFTCSECKLVTVSRRDLKQHMKFHRKGPELKLFCEHCSFVTDCESRLRRHELIHTKEKPFQCGLCEYRGSQKEHVLRHMRSMHNIDVMRRKRKSPSGEDITADNTQMGMKDLSRLIDKNDYSTKDKIFACNHCTMKFSKLINLYKHLHTQHRNIMPSEQEDEFSCVVCDFRTNTKKNLLVHMRKHNMTDHSPPSHLYSCVLCRYTNPKRRNLFQHMRKKHHIEIVMKDDGSTSCFVTDTSNIQEDVDQLLTVGDVVTTTTADTDSQDDVNGIQSVITLEDLATIVAPEPNHDGNLIIEAGQLHNTALGSLVHQHEAAEAIEGLQALAGSINLADSVIEEVQVMDDPGLDPITMETTTETSKEGDGEKPSIQLSAEHLLHLSSGDFVEINGEMYKVEITADDSAKATPATLTAVQDIVQSSM